MGYLEKAMNVKLAVNIISGAFFRIIYYYFLLKSEGHPPVNMDDFINEFLRILFQGIVPKNA